MNTRPWDPQGRGRGRGHQGHFWRLSPHPPVEGHQACFSKVPALPPWVTESVMEGWTVPSSRSPGPRHELQHQVPGEMSLMRAVPVARSLPGHPKRVDPDPRPSPATCSHGLGPPAVPPLLLSPRPSPTPTPRRGTSPPPALAGLSQQEGPGAGSPTGEPGHSLWECLQQPGPGAAPSSRSQVRPGWARPSAGTPALLRGDSWAVR